MVFVRFILQNVTNAAQNAFDRVWAVPFKSRPNYFTSRLRGIALLALLGTLFIVATGASGVVSGGLGGPAAKIAGIVVSFVFNVLLFLAAFEKVLFDQGFRVSPGAGVGAAIRVYSPAEPVAAGQHK